MNTNLAIVVMSLFLVFVPCAVMAYCGAFSIDALGRNPSQAARTFITMITILGSVEVLSVIGLLQLFMMLTP